MLLRDARSFADQGNPKVADPPPRLDARQSSGTRIVSRVGALQQAAGASRSVSSLKRRSSSARSPRPPTTTFARMTDADAGAARSAPDARAPAAVAVLQVLPGARARAPFVSLVAARWPEERCGLPSGGGGGVGRLLEERVAGIYPSTDVR